MIGKLCCAAGLHNDGTDVSGGYSPTCLRCDRPVSTGPTSTFRGTLMALCGYGMQTAAIIKWDSQPTGVTVMAAGVLLVLFGCVMIWRKL